MTESKFLFDFSEPEPQGYQPLADRMRPRTPGEIMGQEHLLGPDGVLRRAIDRDEIPSMILWGPPGVGKTTLARVIAGATRARFDSFSAVLSGIREVKDVMNQARTHRRVSGQRTIVFVDEIHRFNKAQQDAFLPYVESGEIVLIGATTENPSFEVISALLSRLKVYVLRALTEEHLQAILRRALEDAERGLGALRLQVGPGVLERLAVFCGGDARMALNALELAAGHVSGGETEAVITLQVLEEVLQRKGFLYDRQGEEHFNLISALHKTLRNSDPDAALYWLGRMLEAGEDPMYVARRLVRFASEDIGLADPNALGVALRARDAFHFLGMPEGGVALAQAVIYLSLAPKSNSAYLAYEQVRRTMQETRNEPVPEHLRNAPTRLMKDLGYGEGYEYAHDLEERVSAMPGLPASLQGTRFYQPTEEGLEKRFKERLAAIAALRKTPSRRDA